MTTDPTPDWEQVLNRLDRAIEVLEEIRDARRDQVEVTTMADPDVDPVVYAALDRMRLAKRHHQGRLRP